MQTLTSSCRARWSRPRRGRWRAAWRNWRRTRSRSSSRAAWPRPRGTAYNPSYPEPSCCRRESGRRSSSCSVRERRAATARRRSSRPHSVGGTRSSRSPRDARAVARIASRGSPAGESLRTPSMRSSRRAVGTASVAAGKSSSRVRTSRRAPPNITLSPDVRGGFPGKSEEQLEASRDLIRRVRRDMVNVPRFPPREGTPAATMAGQIVGWKVKDRSRRLTRLRFQISRDGNERFVGREVEVLVTEPGKPGTVLARTREYRQVVLREPATIGEFLRVKIDGARATDLSGHVLTNGLYTPVQIHAGSPVV